MVPAKPLPSAVCVSSGVKSTFIGVYSEASTLPSSRNAFRSRVLAFGCSLQNETV